MGLHKTTHKDTEKDDCFWIYPEGSTTSRAWCIVHCGDHQPWRCDPDTEFADIETSPDEEHAVFDLMYHRGGCNDNDPRCIHCVQPVTPLHCATDGCEWQNIDVADGGRMDGQWYCFECMSQNRRTGIMAGVSRDEADLLHGLRDG